MTAPLEYIKAVADQASERSVPGSVTVELARLTREVVTELRAAREVVEVARSDHPCAVADHDLTVDACEYCVALVAYDQAVTS